MQMVPLVLDNGYQLLNILILQQKPISCKASTKIFIYSIWTLLNPMLNDPHHRTDAAVGPDHMPGWMPA